MITYYEYQGIKCPVFVPAKELPQDGARIVRMLEEKAKEYYMKYFADLLYQCDITLMKAFINYTNRTGLVPRSVDLYPVVLDIQTAKWWPDEAIERSILVNLKNANELMVMFKKRIKQLEEKLERL